MIANCHFLAFAKSNFCLVKLGKISLLIFAKILYMEFFCKNRKRLPVDSLLIEVYFDFSSASTFAFSASFFAI